MLAFFLKPGGNLLVADILDHSEAAEGGASTNLFDEQFHHVIPHTKGFKSDDLRKVFEGAGLVSFSIHKAIKAQMHDQPITIFVAKGQKPAI